MITYRDIKAQITRTTDANEGTYDVDGIVGEFVQRFGLVNTDDVDYDELWELILRHVRD